MFIFQVLKYTEIFPLRPQTGTLYYQSKTLLGKFTPMGNKEVLLGTETQTYTARVIKDMHGDNVVLTWKIKAKGFDGFAGWDIKRNKLS
ncbi:MAG TPA: hypothetical protein DCK79_05775 [Candidatus Atribacteria bacterium]|jgi:hypothetical protein|nr:hypothetical protein [Candidatus Atribacteria bacterium]